jgi:hypothetical protein
MPVCNISILDGSRMLPDNPRAGAGGNCRGLGARPGSLSDQISRSKHLAERSEGTPVAGDWLPRTGAVDWLPRIGVAVSGEHPNWMQAGVA